MIIISPLLRIYRNFRLNLLVEKILKNWNINYKHKLSIEDLSIIKEIFYHKRYSSYFQFYKKCNILDIGAHKGFFALLASEQSQLRRRWPYWRTTVDNRHRAPA